jgi:ribonuclease T1
VLRSGQASLGRALHKLGLAFALAASLSGPAAARSSAPQIGPVETVALAELPAEARQTQALIERGGPFPYRKDGAVFGNRERLLPAQPRGYYREYTVPTPGAPDRGARRIVCGGAESRRPQACYYTADHYASFKRIAQ